MMTRTCETCLRGPTPSLTLRYCAECGDERKYHALMRNRPEPEAVDCDALKKENDRLRAGIGACHATKTDHPDLVDGIVWSDCELAWINERITLAILAEREECAYLAEVTASGRDAEAIAEAIRARSNA